MTGHSPARYEELKAAVTAARLQFDQPDDATDVLEDVEETPVQIPSRDGHGDGSRTIAGRLYRSKEAAASTASGGPTPVLVNWHGSGLVFHWFGQDRPYCAQVAREIPGLVVLDADYRKAPEDPFPAAVHDTEDVLRWVASQPDVYDASRVALSGFSAGGLLALLQIPVVVAVYPTVDLSVPAAERKQVETPIQPIPAHMAALFDECWTPDPETRKDPRCSSGRADPALFPDHVVILTCGGDNCAPEANDLAAKLKDGKRKVVHEVMEGMPHAFDKTCKPGTPEWGQKEKMNALIIQELKEALRI
ncbi:Uu.00g085900.m01.CDS01 [Anthostomella pinea]|uniref:Uu.00g085900.m01.CDS01 n=1 Tax=Anthostomella pinea TaxID=933095 RepID=A0AAI8VM13_9PEZI|nr:Uu.00g085900.m01.CDS01 [Anthostomella pinea]